MLTVADLLTLIEEQREKTVKQLVKETGISEEQLSLILKDLSKHNLVEYDEKTGKVALPKWLLNVGRKVEKESPVIGEIIIPKGRELQLMDMVIGNYTSKDLEVKVSFRARLREISICEIAEPTSKGV